MNVRTVYTSGTTVYAGTTAGLFKSVGGGGWQPVAQGPEDDPKNPKKLNARRAGGPHRPGGTMLAGVASGGVYRSTDGGATWTAARARTTAWRARRPSGASASSSPA